AFEKDFLRWMLSDGAAAVLMSDTPNKDKLSLKVEWIDFVSFANQAEPCMYAGAEKINGALKGWADYNTTEWLDKSIFSIKQDVKLLDKNITALGSIAFSDSLKKHHLKASEIDHYLPHISSMYFADKVYAEMEKSGDIVPREKWFTNLTKVGNVGAASIFLALEELLNRGNLKKGQTVFLKVPESARFSYAHALLTVC
ncbi:MAG: 3-oxoacyl-[acyl-carrier-protein] synthase III C-terminal domain-containing protein, partial [Bacteroidia bacterium]